MKNNLVSIFKKIKRPSSIKISEVGALVACGTVGNPVWTPRRYDSLAEEGCKKNVIVYRCVNLIARGIGSVPCLLYQEEKEIAQHPLLDLLNPPIPRQAGIMAKHHQPPNLQGGSDTTHMDAVEVVGN